MLLKRLYGIYLSLEEAIANKRRNMYIPAADGQIYHLMENELLAVCSVAEQVPDLPVLKEGIRFKLPRKIDTEILLEFISVAQFYAEQYTTEVHGEVYWHREKQCYKLHIPKQTVSMENVIPKSNFILETRNVDWIKMMEIHSHHHWEATPSPTDDAHEQETILYAIVGKVNQLFPDISVRTYFVGKHICIDPREVFESPFAPLRNPLSQVEVMRGGKIND